MRENVGGWDQKGRAVLGPALIGLGYIRLGGHDGRWPGLLAMAAGLGVAATAVTRTCPVNDALGIDTARRIQLQ